MRTLIYELVEESNKIEGIIRKPTKEELDEFIRFMDLKELSIDELKRFVSVYQPNATLRERHGLDVRVGSHVPPKGGFEVVRQLYTLLERINNGERDAYSLHVEYETLHPFTDCNGRSGRMLWAWLVGYDGLNLGFLHKWYYMSLARRQ